MKITFVFIYLIIFYKNILKISKHERPRIINRHPNGTTSGN